MTFLSRYRVLTERIAIMAWIHNSNTATRRLYDADLDEEVTFSKNGKSQVSEGVAEQLIERYDTIGSAESDNDDADADADEDDDE